MNGYLLSVVGTILLCALLTAILPNGKTSETIGKIARLACLVAIVAPIPKLLQGYKARDETNGENFFNESGIRTDETFIQYYCERRIELAERALERELQEKFDCSVSTEFVWEWKSEGVSSVYDDEAVYIRQIKLHGESWNEEERMSVAAYVTKYYCSEVLLE